MAAKAVNIAFEPDPTTLPPIVGGYPVDRIVDAKDADIEANTCAICYKVQKESTCLPCKHRFCRECIGRWTVVTRQPSCPLCRVNYQSHVDFRPHELALQIKCRKDCGFVGSEQQEWCHYRFECEFGPKTVQSPFQCAICSFGIRQQCLTCQVESDDTCKCCIGVKLEQCDHAYHMHCLLRWMQTRSACPLCDSVLENPK